jgi:hypothetical protein
VRHFRARLVRHGPFIPVRLFVGAPIVDGEEQDRSHRLQVLVGTETTSRAVLMMGDGGIPVEIEGITLRSVEPIGQADYDFMVAHRTWAADHAPDHPTTTPRRAVDFHRMKMPY